MEELTKLSRKEIIEKYLDLQLEKDILETELSTAKEIIGLGIDEETHCDKLNIMNEKLIKSITGLQLMASARKRATENIENINEMDKQALINRILCLDEEDIRILLKHIDYKAKTTKINNVNLFKAQKVLDIVNSYMRTLNEKVQKFIKLVKDEDIQGCSKTIDMGDKTSVEIYISKKGETRLYWSTSEKLNAFESDFYVSKDTLILERHAKFIRELIIMMIAKYEPTEIHNDDFINYLLFRISKFDIDY